jgi:hypothetical protein
MAERRMRKRLIAALAAAGNRRSAYPPMAMVKGRVDQAVAALRAMDRNIRRGKA